MSIDYSRFAFSKTKVKVKKENKAIKKKSDKLNKLERKRFSIIQKDNSYCYLCGVSNKVAKLDKHEALEGRNRRLSMKYGLVYYLCRRCHSKAKMNIETKKQLQTIAKGYFIKEYTDKDFREIFK